MFFLLIVFYYRGLSQELRRAKGKLFFFLPYISVYHKEGKILTLPISGSPAGMLETRLAKDRLAREKQVY